MTQIRRKKDAAQQLAYRTHKNGVAYLQCDALDRTGCVRHAFATRIGGVSKAPYATMNLSFTRGDDPDDVSENYRLMAEVLEKTPEDIVCTYQTHTTNIRVVTSQDRGKGVVRERGYVDVDALITNETGVVLSCFWADCVPLLFVDPVRKAIGVAHAGWRGSVGGIGIKTIDAMSAQYGTRAQDLHVAIGPSICADCYEIGEDVAEEVMRAMPEAKTNHVLFQNENTAKDKYQLDLWRLNRLLLTRHGVPESQIHATDICTKCNPELLFSHRVHGETRGNLAGFLTLV